jgi:hypothetical protein
LLLLPSFLCLLLSDEKQKQSRSTRREKNLRFSTQYRLKRNGLVEVDQINSESKYQILQFDNCAKAGR